MANDDDKPLFDPSRVNINTILSLIVIGALTWIGTKTSSNNDNLTKIEATLPYVSMSVSKLEAQIAQLVSRSELDSRILEIKVTETELEKRVVIIESKLPVSSR